LIVLAVLQLRTSAQSPIYIEGVEFTLDVPDEEFSTDDFVWAIVALEERNYSADTDDEPHGSPCPQSLRISPLENPRLRIWLKTECDSPYTAETYFYGKLAYPVHDAFNVGHHEWTPMIEEEMNEIVSILGLTSEVEDIFYDDIDSAQRSAFLDLILPGAILTILAALTSVGLALAVGFLIIRRRRDHFFERRGKKEE